jgi:hypothetical protein
MTDSASNPRKRLFYQHAWGIVLVVMLGLLGFVTVYTADVSIADDMGWYMTSGLNLFPGRVTPI